MDAYQDEVRTHRVRKALTELGPVDRIQSIALSIAGAIKESGGSVLLEVVPQPFIEHELCTKDEFLSAIRALQKGGFLTLDATHVRITDLGRGLVAEIDNRIAALKAKEGQ